MSWNIGRTNVQADEVVDALKDDLKTGTFLGQVGVEDEMREQAGAAIDAVSKLLSVVVFEGDKRVNVQLSGHANRGRLPIGGKAGDSVTIVVSQAPDIQT